MSSSPSSKYEAICEASPDAIVLVDADGRITYANGRVADLFGYDPAALLGEPIEVLVPDELREGHVGQREAYMGAPETRPMAAALDLEAQRKDGSTFPVNISLSPIDTGSGVEIMASVRDTSEQEVYRTQYRTILESIPDAVIIADAETGEIVEANEQVDRLLGYSSEELVGKEQTALHPSGKEERYRELFQQHDVPEDNTKMYRWFPDGSPLYVETADGTTVPVEIHAKGFELANRHLVVGIFHEITERQKREQQLEALNETAHDLMSADTQAEIANIGVTAAQDVLGLDANAIHLYDEGESGLVPVAQTDVASELIGDPPTFTEGDGIAWRVYDTGESLALADVHDDSDIYNPDSAAQSELFLPLGEHGILIATSDTPAAFDRHDVILGELLTGTIVAAFEQIERTEQLRTREKALTQRNEQLEDFASIVSHDLRNPLNVAQLRLDMTRNTGESVHLDDVRNAHERMENLIEDLLTLARKGNQVDEQSWVDFEDLVEGCWQHIDSDGATLTTDCHRTLKADRSRLQQLLENLLRNAVEHGSTSSQATPDDAVEHGSTSSESNPHQNDEEHGSSGVRVTVGELSDGFYVEDTGPGIPENDRTTVFESGHSTDANGTGLGLSIVKQVVDAHGWNVQITDGTEGGARFEITGVEFTDDANVVLDSE